jgi:hypothetical protein
MARHLYPPYTPRKCFGPRRTMGLSQPFQICRAARHLVAFAAAACGGVETQEDGSQARWGEQRSTD